MPGWNFADAFEVVAEQLPDATAQVHGDRRYTWREFDRRSDGVALALLEAGAERQDKVALYVHNGPEYMEACTGAWKAGLVPVNTNYRYTADELAYLWDNADAVAVVFHGTFAETARRRPGPGAGAHLAVGRRRRPGPAPTGPRPTRTPPPWPPTAPSPAGAGTATTSSCSTRAARPACPRASCGARTTCSWPTPTPSLPQYGEEMPTSTSMRQSLTGRAPVHVPACPLMHGTGWFTALMALMTGGGVVTLTGRTFDAVELLDTVEREGVNMMAIVGDAFAKPMLRALDAEPGRWDLSSLVAMISSGVMWSEADQAGPARATTPGCCCSDAFSSSEALDMGGSISSAGAAAETAKFTLGHNAMVVGDDGRDRRAGLRARSAGWRSAASCPSGTTRTPRSRRPRSSRSTASGTRCRATTPRSRPTARSPCSAGARCASTRAARRSSPRRSRRPSSPTRPCATPWPSGVPDEKFGEAVTAVVEPDGDAARRRGRGHRPREADAGRLQGAEAGPDRRHHRPGAPTARSTTRRCGPSPRTNCGSDPRPRGRAGTAERPRYRLVVARTTRRTSSGPAPGRHPQRRPGRGPPHRRGWCRLPARPPRRRAPRGPRATASTRSRAATRPRTSSSSAPTAPKASTPTTRSPTGARASGSCRTRSWCCGSIPTRPRPSS